MKTYKFIEHTADVGIRVYGRSLKELFQNSAGALFDIVAERKKGVVPKAKNFAIRLEAQTQEELLVSWLNELISLAYVKKFIFSQFRITKLDENTLTASIVGQDISGYIIQKEVKAATYHQLRIKKMHGGWQAEVIFDV